MPVKHHFHSSSFAIVRLEDLQEIANLKADLVACYQPVNSQELFAVERIALAQQMILRGARLEAGLFTAALDEVLDRTGDHPIRPMSQELAGDGDIEITRAQNRNFALGEGFRRIARESNAWSLLLRYQTQAERQYRRAIEEFDRLKSLRHELPNEPGPGTGPESKEDIALLQDEPAINSCAEPLACEAKSLSTPRLHRGVAVKRTANSGSKSSTTEVRKIRTAEAAQEKPARLRCRRESIAR